MLMLARVMEVLPDVTFYWAGDGTYRYQILSVLGKFKNFKWLGKLSYPVQVRQFLSSIDLYVLLTGYDTFGITVVEAEIMKVPVIATNVGGTSETMIKNKTGFLVNQGNYQELIEKITTLLDDQRLAKSMGEAGYIFARENFSWEKTVQKFVTNLKTLV
jgi:glycosyltransferase involved in cell wall biosynthesis